MSIDSLPHWSRFWDMGYITTFGDSKPHNYDGVVLDFWREKFEVLKDGAEILDVAAGNGAIATIAAETGIRLGRNFRVKAIDLADVQPDLIGDEKTRQARKSIDFLSRVSCEEMPFDDDRFDIVTSQFGFEYADAARTLAEIRRVLRSGGRFVAICHHAESSLLGLAREERDIYRAAVDDLDLIGATRNLFDYLGEQPESGEPIDRKDPEYRRLTDEVNDRVRRFQEKFGNDERARIIVGAISYVARTATQTSHEERYNALGKAERDFREHRARLDDMVNAALDRRAIESLAIIARESGFESVHYLKFYTGDSQLGGWQIHLR